MFLTAIIEIIMFFLINLKNKLINGFKDLFLITHLLHFNKNVYCLNYLKINLKPLHLYNF